MEETRRVIRERYGRIATEGTGCCSPGCCGGDDPGTTAVEVSKQLGYDDEDLTAAPQGANLGLGCGNPPAAANLREGDVVLDLGSGGGLDCFLVAQRVGPSGRVIGVDMTPEMVALARDNLRTADVPNVEFRLGEIEHLPVADGEADVVISNCVINLSPDKPAVYREALRALKPGGRLVISDIVARAPLPDSRREDVRAVAGCVGGAATIPAVRQMLIDAGFVDVRIVPLDRSEEIVREGDTCGAYDGDDRLHELVASATIEARRPV